MPERWADTLSGMIGDIACRHAIPERAPKPLTGGTSVCVLCALDTDLPRKTQRRMEDVFRRAVIRQLLMAHVPVSPGSQGHCFMTWIKVATCPSRDLCVFTMRSSLLDASIAADPARTTLITVLWRAVPLCAATRPRRLSRDIVRLIEFHARELIEAFRGADGE